MSLKLNVINVAVTDMNASLAFYRALGLPIPEGQEGEDHVGVELPNGLAVMFDTDAGMLTFDPQHAPQPGSSRTSLAFEADSPAEVDRMYAAVTALGDFGHLEPWDAFWGQRYSKLRDPDGNPVDVYAALPA